MDKPQDASGVRLSFDYAEAKRYAETIGLRWQPEWLPLVDSTFARAKLSQEQVDEVMRLHAWVVKHLFTPSVYSWRQRIAVALFFLLKR